MRIVKDLHTHTYYSHGKGSPRENVLRALELGLSGIAITEHAGGNIWFGVRGRKLERLNDEIAALRREFEGRIEVYNGLECNVTGFGKSDVPKDRENYGVILLGYHKGVAPVNGFNLHILSESFGGKSTPRRNTESIMAAAEKGRVDAISHPGLYLEVDIPYMAECCRQLGVLMEINGARVTMTREELIAARDKGAKFIIGSDAHTPDRISDCAKAIEAAREAGVLESVVNLEL